ncbi:MAG: hypothetical protein HYZ49_13195 [Chloroflexi bacterium]|nr:hypothetical protein [Chloroflexota bacterium]
MVKEQSRETTMGDAAVDGLLAGGMAGVLMAVYLAVAGLTWGDGIGVTLGHFDPGATASPVVGVISHLAVSGVYGALFGVGWRLVARLWQRLSAYAWLGGLAFGLALWGLAGVVLLPGAASALRAVPPLHFVIAHIVYGLTLGIGLSMRQHE